MKQTAAAATDPATGNDPPAAGGTAVDVLVNQMLAVVVQLEGLVPDLTPHDSRQVKRVSAGARFAHDLIVPTITTVTTVPTPEGLFDVENGREAMEYRDKVRPIVQRLAVLVDALTFTVNEKMAGAGEQVLQTYRWSKSAVKGGRRPDLQPYVDEMSRVVKKILNQRPTKDPAPAPDTPTAPPAQVQTFLATSRATSPLHDAERDLYARWSEALAA
jgi:hypothetical protein